MKPGIYHDVSFDDYRKIKAVNNSLLWTLKSKSPAHAKHSLEKEEKDTDILLLGHAFHCLTLEPDTFHTRYAVGPNVRRNSNDWKEAVADAEAEGQSLLTQDQFDKINAMAKEVAASKLNAYFSKGFFELTLVWRDSTTGLLCKARCDYVRQDHHVITDLKSCVDASPRGFQKHAYNFGYHQQAAMYRDGYRALVGDRPSFVFIAVEKTPPYLFHGYECDDEMLDAGRTSYKEAMELYKQCTSSGAWPGYGDSVDMITLPEWRK